MTAPRRVSADTVWRVARLSLGRMACNETGTALLDPATHNHAECVVDDEAYAADLLLRLAAAASSGDDTAILDRVTDLQAAVATGG